MLISVCLSGVPLSPHWVALWVPLEGPLLLHPVLGCEGSLSSSFYLSSDGRKVFYTLSLLCSFLASLPLSHTPVAVSHVHNSQNTPEKKGWQLHTQILAQPHICPPPLKPSLSGQVSNSLPISYHMTYNSDTQEIICVGQGVCTVSNSQDRVYALWEYMYSEYLWQQSIFTMTISQNRIYALWVNPWTE